LVLYAFFASYFVLLLLTALGAKGIVSNVLLCTMPKCRCCVVEAKKRKS